VEGRESSRTRSCVAGATKSLKRSKLDLPISPASDCPVGQYHQRAQRMRVRWRGGNEDNGRDAETSRQVAHPSLVRLTLAGSPWEAPERRRARGLEVLGMPGSSAAKERRLVSRESSGQAIKSYGQSLLGTAVRNGTEPEPERERALSRQSAEDS
jgi:hypothetical protein